MNLNILKPRQALSKAFLKVKPGRADIERFKQNLAQLMEHTNESESEEFHKNLISTFLKDTYYADNHFINTKGRNDLVIHNGKDAQSSVGVIVEAKKPTNRVEMPKTDNINTKAFQELVLYYLRERITAKNIDIKYLIATNIYEWFIFDAQLFEKLFAQSKTLVGQFNDFEENRLSVHKTEGFYREIAEPFINEIKAEIPFTHFDIRDFIGNIRNADKHDDSRLIALYKLLSPEHLLKLPFVNDSNSLDRRFYSELLHIIGLTETKVGGKKLIERKAERERNAGSLVENAIIQLDSLDKMSSFERPYQFGETHGERLFNVALELSITWVNRILFLKLLEAQLIAYHKGDKSHSFLNIQKVKNYDDLNSLFFQVLARTPDVRNEEVKRAFTKVPYLNSSLFEPTPVEHGGLFISQLGSKKLPVLGTTVLKDTSGKRRAGEMDSLEYFFEFLNAYDFTDEGLVQIQEDNKTLINASVLGLIFEKINGYRDGSFFTPSVITMYLCREAIRRAVIQRFNEVKGWNCADMVSLYNKIGNLVEANQIINSLKICDPAVGSGHFLVSALNEIVAVKGELGVLLDRSGKRLKNYRIEVENDELMITDENGEFLEYNPRNPESQRVQETIFHEKQTIIENCLFGVDINPNSVKICRLRLWIELLKSAYYKKNKGGGMDELETLPNIDINIKCGNSLISRYALDADIKAALRRSKWSIENYRLAVMAYRNAQNKDEKRAMERLIGQIKSDFESEISTNDRHSARLSKAQGELLALTAQTTIFDRTRAEKTAWEKQVKTLTERVRRLEAELEEIRHNKIYENAFEWRFEFPEVLNDDGNFAGFDIVIGNPPYMQLQKMGKESDSLGKMGFETFTRTGDIYSLFYELGFRLLKQSGILAFITSNKWMRTGYGESTRRFFAEKTNPVLLIDFAGQKIFDEATVDTNILMLTKQANLQKTLACMAKENALNNLSVFVKQQATECRFTTGESWTILSPIEQSIKQKIEAVGIPLREWDISIYRGVLTGYNEAFIINGKRKDELIATDPKSAEIIRPILRGRDIKRYGYNFADLWLINTHNGIKEKGVKPINAADYPAIKTHLDQFYPELKKRADKGDTPYNLRNCAYIDDFYRQKIVWKRIGSILRFSYDEKGMITLDSTCFAVGKHIKFLVAVLNSKMGKYLMTDSPQTGTGDLLISVQAIEPLKIPIPDEETETLIETLVDELLKIQNEIGESKIDESIFKLYGLTPDEANFIRSR